MMRTSRVEIVARDNGERCMADLLICDKCLANTWYIYVPVGIDHAHFQCINCGLTFCDRCTKTAAAAPPGPPTVTAATEGGAS